MARRVGNPTETPKFDRAQVALGAREKEKREGTKLPTNLECWTHRRPWTQPLRHFSCRRCMASRLSIARAREGVRRPASRLARASASPLPHRPAGDTALGPTRQGLGRGPVALRCLACPPGSLREPHGLTGQHRCFGHAGQRTQRNPPFGPARPPTPRPATGRADSVLFADRSQDFAKVEKSTLVLGSSWALWALGAVSGVQRASARFRPPTKRFPLHVRLQLGLLVEFCAVDKRLLWERISRSYATHVVASIGATVVLFRARRGGARMMIPHVDRNPYAEQRARELDDALPKGHERSITSCLPAPRSDDTQPVVA